MAQRDALDVLNRLVATGGIRDYAIAADERAWRDSVSSVREATDILVVPAASEMAGPDGGLLHLLALLEKDDCCTPGDYSINVAGWDVCFLMATSELEQEAVMLAIERELVVEETGRVVRARILDPAHFAALMLAWITAQNWLCLADIIGEEDVDRAELADIVSRHGMQAKWRKFCVREGIK